MKKITAILLAIIFIIGLIPFLWLQDGKIISNGDNIPASLNAAKTFSTSFYMWSPDFLGYASPTPSYLLNTYLASYLGDLGLSVGLIQILFQVLLYMTAGFSMYYFTRKIYPNTKFAPFFAALFYMLNFFILMSRFNLGFAWTYAFLPLILALFTVTVNAAYRHDKKATFMGTIGFAIASIVPFSIASVNPANIALFLISLSVLAIYFLVKYRRKLLPFASTLGLLALLTVLVNLWWLLPMINTFFLSLQSLGTSVNVDSWSWTHQRGSFLNLFTLNGVWGWDLFYIPEALFNYYANPVVAFLMFVPFILAGAALFFKSEKSRFNAFVAFSILIFVFLAKGLHEPLGQINLLFYQYVPLMNMFREPASKFTLIIIPFLALLIGYTVNYIIQKDFHFRPQRTKLLKTIFVAFTVGTFVVSALPVFTIPVNFAETKTTDLSYSSYVQIPQYWTQATDWVNSQQGDWKVLLTPLNDFYEMPYTWGYFGTDVLLERLFDKPILSTSALDGYISNPGPAADLVQIRAAVKFNRTDEFQALLNLLNIKYIVQRNDVDTNVTGRNLRTPQEMQTFFAEQPYLKLVQSFGQLDIYEYTQAKPSMYALLPSTLQQTDLYVDRTGRINQTWNFDNQNDFQDWNNNTMANQSQATCLLSQPTNQPLEADIFNSTSSWVSINSPMFPANIETSYSVKATISGSNVSFVDLKVAEYSKNMTLLTNSSVGTINWGTFDKYVLSQRFETQSCQTKFYQIQIWCRFDANQTTESKVWLNSINLNGVTSTLNMTGLENIYVDMNSNQSTVQIKNFTPTKITASINTSQPFILATSQSLDKFWVAYVNGQQIQPMTTYLGLKGFMINQTGQYDVTLEYTPQQWFNYSLIISGVTALFLCVGVVYLQRTKLKEAYQKVRGLKP